jgi:hypothetical protein
MRTRCLIVTGLASVGKTAVLNRYARQARWSAAAPVTLMWRAERWRLEWTVQPAGVSPGREWRSSRRSMPVPSRSGPIGHAADAAHARAVVLALARNPLDSPRPGLRADITTRRRSDSRPRASRQASLGTAAPGAPLPGSAHATSSGLGSPLRVGCCTQERWSTTTLRCSTSAADASAAGGGLGYPRVPRGGQRGEVCRCVRSLRACLCALSACGCGWEGYWAGMPMRACAVPMAT